MKPLDPHKEPFGKGILRPLLDTPTLKEHQPLWQLVFWQSSFHLLEKYSNGLYLRGTELLFFKLHVFPALPQLLDVPFLTLAIRVVDFCDLPPFLGLFMRGCGVGCVALQDGICFHKHREESFVLVRKAPTRRHFNPTDDLLCFGRPEVFGRSRLQA